MDVTPYMELKIAPRAIFDNLEQRRAQVRFMVPANGPDGDWTAVTWAGFADQIRRIAQYLMHEGLKSGERAAIFADNRVEWMSAAMGIQALGAAMVPIYPSSTADAAAYIAEHSDARFIFVDSAQILARIFEEWGAYGEVLKFVVMSEEIDALEVLHGLRSGQGAGLPTVGEVAKRVVSWAEAQRVGRWLDAENPTAFDNAMDRVSLDSMGMMLYTSGTTGRPKGVPLTHRNVAVNGRDWMTCNAPLVEEGAVDVLWLPMSHIFGFGEACLGNTLGFTTYLADSTTVLDRLPEVRPSVFMSVPRYFEKIAEAVMGEADPKRRQAKLAQITGGRFKFCLSGGAGLKREVKDFFFEAGILIIEGYGLTEASPTLTLNRPDAYRFDTVGKPLPSVELKLGEDGEILARGESIFGGYHKDSAATKATFTDDGWLKTGDLGRFTDDGFLQIVGRKKEILVTAAGKNISPVNIEQRFVNDPYIQQVVVYGDAQKYLVAGVWVNPEAVAAQLGQGASDDAVRALLAPRFERVNSELARYETIKKFAVIDEPLSVENGYLTPTLKVKRNQVYAAFGEQLQALYED